MIVDPMLHHCACCVDERIEAEQDAIRYRHLCEWREWSEDIEAAFDCSSKVIIDAAIDSSIAARERT